MKRKLLLILICLIFCLFSITGCSSTKKTVAAGNNKNVVKLDDRKLLIEGYLKAFESGQYNSMYSMLSADSVKSITEKSFTDRMNNIYSAINAMNITASPKYPKSIKEEKDGTVIIPFSVSMDTLAGKLTYDNQAILMKEKVDGKDKWSVVWKDKMIFPQMEDGDKVGFQRYVAKRGTITDRNDKPLALGTLNRSYPFKEACAHLIGYVKAISAEQLKSLKSQGYTNGDIIGQTGLEKVFESRLRGEYGGIIFTKDGNGNRKVTILEKQPKDGENINLTVDASLQQAIYAQISADNGTCVAVSPKTGEVMAMVSSPSYDPNLFVKGISNSDWQAIQNNKGNPMVNRFTQSFAPGSTFKAVTAAIALKNGKLDPSAGDAISGLQWQMDKSWGSYYITRVDNVAPPENLQKAFVYSDNIYFAKAAINIGKELFVNEAKNLGIGEDIKFEYPLNKSQISGDGTLKNNIQLADSGYGQGQVLMNPVQLSLIYSSLVNGGTIMRPYLEQNSSNAGAWKENTISSDACNIIINDLIQVVENPAGTGYGAYTPGLKLAGKTGTAEIKQNVNDKNGTENGWFIAVNPDNPKLLVTMMIENVKDKGGSHYVVPKVAAVMRQFAK